MRFTDIQIQNFLSFGDRVDVSLDRRGLLAVFGHNLDSATADSNGSGKSSLMEAIVWCLYGQTMRGYKSDEVINRRIGRDCLVSLQLQDDNHTYVVTRTRKLSGTKKPNDVLLSVDGGAVTQGINQDTQTLINTIIGMDYETFTQSVMLYHRGRSFSELKDSEQKAVLEEILQIDELSKARAVVRGRVIERQQDLSAVLAKIQFIEQRTEQGSIQLNKLKSQRDQHVTLMRQRRYELLHRKAQTEVRMEEVYRETGLAEMIARKDSLQSDFDAIDKKRDDIHAKMMQASRKYADQRSDLSKKEGKLQGLMDGLSPAIHAISNLAGKVCPTCHRAVDPNEATDTIDTLEGRKQEYEKHRAELEKQRRAVVLAEQKDLAKLQTRRGKLDQKAEKLEAELIDVGTNIAKRRSELRLICQLEQQVFNIRTEIDQLDDSENPYHELIEEAEREIDDLQKQLGILRYQERAYDLELRHLNFWDHGFGNAGMKSYVIENVIPFLNARAQKYADILTGGDLQIEFSTKTKLKSGEWREQFQVKVINKAGADVYKGNSDGERRRIDLAVGWALGDLAATRAKKPIRFKGLDEPFENLDDSGEDHVIKLLHSVLSEYETIMCITHSTHLRQQFPNELLVQKENGISTVL